MIIDQYYQTLDLAKSSESLLVLFTEVTSYSCNGN